MNQIQGKRERKFWHVRLCIAIIFEYHFSVVHINEADRWPPTRSHHVSHMLRLLHIGLKKTLPDLKSTRERTHQYLIKSTLQQSSHLHISGICTNLCLHISRVVVFGMCAQEMDWVELDLFLALLHSWLIKAISYILLVLYFPLWNTLLDNTKLSDFLKLLALLSGYDQSA